MTVREQAVPTLSHRDFNGKVSWTWFWSEKQGKLTQLITLIINNTIPILCPNDSVL